VCNNSVEEEVETTPNLTIQTTKITRSKMLHIAKRKKKYIEQEVASAEQEAVEEVTVEWRM